MSKFNGPLLLVSETFGGVNGRAVRYLTRLSHMARSASDEIYLDRAGRVISFFVHFACAISSAAAVGHGRAIQKHAMDVRAQAARLRSDARAMSDVPVSAPGVVSPPFPHA